MEKNDNVLDDIISSDSSCFVIGDSCSGKTSLAISIAHQIWSRNHHNNSPKKVYLISANRHLADLSKRNFVKHALAQQLTSPVINIQNASLDGIEFRTINAFAYHLLNKTTTDSDNNPEEAIELLSGPEEDMLLGRVIAICRNEFASNNKFTKYMNMLNLSSAQSQIRDTLAVCIQFRISPENLIEIAQKEEFEIWELIANIYAKYLDELNLQNKSDSNTMFIKASEVIENTNMLNIDTLIIDDAQELNPLSAYLVEKLSQSGVKIVLIGNPFETVNFFRGSISNFHKGKLKVNLGNNTKEFYLNNTTGTATTSKMLSQIERDDKFIATENSHQAFIHIANLVREYHLKNGTDYRQIAIIARNSSVLEKCHKFLTIHNIPSSFRTNINPIKSEKIYHQLKNTLTKDPELSENLETQNAAQLLWQAWIKLDIADKLQNNVLRKIEENYSNHILDTVIQIIELAKEHPKITDFFEYIENQNINADNIFAKKEENQIQLLTPSSALGRHFQHVFILEVNEGTWPNMRLRGQTFKTKILFDLLSGELNSYKEYREIDDRNIIKQTEMMLFEVALSRSKNTQIFFLKDDVNLPSEFIEDYVENLGITNTSETLLSLEDEARKIRTELVKDEIIDQKLNEDQKSQLFRQLKLLEKENAESINPKNWYYSNYAIEEFIDFDEKNGRRQIVLGPSALESLLTCPLKWFFDKQASGTQKNQAADIGTIVHKCAEKIYQKQGPFETQLKLISGSSETEFVKKTDKTFMKLLECYQEIRDDFGYQDLHKVEKLQMDTKVKSLLQRVVGYYKYIENTKFEVAKIENKNALELECEAKLGEIEINNQTVDIKLFGKIDRVEQEYSYNSNNEKEFHKTYKIVDWKTGKNVWKKNENSNKIYEEYNMQLFAYELMFIQKFPDLCQDNKGEVIANISSSLLYLKKETNISDGDMSSKRYRPLFGDDNIAIQAKPDHKITDPRTYVADQILENIQEILNSKTFAAKKNSSCGFCDFKNSCPQNKSSGRVGQVDNGDI